jgi:hypothetical protein
MVRASPPPLTCRSIGGNRFVGRYKGSNPLPRPVRTRTWVAPCCGKPCFLRPAQAAVPPFVQPLLVVWVTLTRAGGCSAAGHVSVPSRHPLRLHLEYIAHLYQKVPPPSEQDRFEVRPPRRKHLLVQWSNPLLLCVKGFIHDKP